MAQNDPLHGITLEEILYILEGHYGWDGLSQHIDIRCFKQDPSIKSSLKFLRKTPWARSKVERLYIELVTTGDGPENREPKPKKENKLKTEFRSTTQTHKETHSVPPVTAKKEPKQTDLPTKKPIDSSKFTF